MNLFFFILSKMENQQRNSEQENVQRLSGSSESCGEHPCFKDEDIVWTLMKVREIMQLNNL